MADIREMQSQVKEYDNKFGWDKDTASHIVLHITEELGEVSRRIMRYEGYKIENFSKKELAEEITDMLYLTLKLANKFDINIEKEWQEMWIRYKDKKSRI